MKKIKIRQMHGGSAMLTDPESPTGNRRAGLRVGEICNIPDDVPLSKVMIKINQCAWLAMPERIDYAEIVPGKIFTEKK